MRKRIQYTLNRKKENGTMPYKNPEKQKAWYEANKDKHNANMKAYREKNKEKIRALNKTYYEDHKEKKKAYYEVWAKNNRDIKNINDANRRALQFRATIRLTELDKFVIDELYNLAKLRTEQTGFSWHVDHIKPLTKGGLHKPTNLQVVPGIWNVTKGNRSEDKWM
jgi:hypothetical protein